MEVNMSAVMKEKSTRTTSRRREVRTSKERRAERKGNKEALLVHVFSSFVPLQERCNASIDWAAAVHQGRELMETDLRGVQDPLDLF
ncbi:hypothetical protein EYF80_021747 [Liparis tanakae]|uniref:Uncharacterized protein n=1 Tax=Liparis tanakae TaxID=230148 RepID=A0A4Z2HTB6_9TELE|nr:hypothetical protein EYF80_021747 [Liparis tanakae]